MFYKMFQALEPFPLKQVNSKQTTPDQSVSKGFMTEEREKTGIPKQQGRGSLASCPKQIQFECIQGWRFHNLCGLRGLTALAVDLFSLIWSWNFPRLQVVLVAPVPLQGTLGAFLFWNKSFSPSSAGEISRSIKNMRLYSRS